MRWRCTANWGSGRLRRIAPIRLRGRCIWSCNCSAGVPAGRGGFALKISCLVLVLLFALSAFAATSKSVSYKSGDDTVQALIYAPEGKGPFPGILVIHEWWGLNDWVKEQASKLSDLGYVTLAIDLYRGKVATTPDEAHEIMRGVPEDRAARDLHAAFEFLKSQANVKKDRIASIGWCM